MNKEREMMHIDDWLDARHAKAPTDEGELFALEWLEHFRKPAMDKDWKYLSGNPLFCTYQGKRFRCIGCSRMGDVWLTSNFSRDTGYEHRIDVDDCSQWSKTSSPPQAE